MFKSLKIYWLKKRAKRLYLHYRNLTDDLDCGMQMALTLRGAQITSAARKFDSCVDELALLGFEVPSARLSAEILQ